MIYGYGGAFSPSIPQKTHLFYRLTVAPQATIVAPQATMEVHVGRVSVRELRRRGVADDDIQTARALQEAQRRAGAPVLPLAAIVGLESPPRGSQGRVAAPVEDLTTRALRRRGAYDQAALLLDQRALVESSPDRAERARDAARIAKELSVSSQLEFDFFGGGNVSIAFQYHDAISARLRESGESLAKQHQALAVLWTITRHLSWQSFECTKTAADLCQLTGIDKSHMARCLDLLEKIGAIGRLKRGRSKVIIVTPEGAFRGSVHAHGDTVERYRLEVIEGGKRDD